MERIAVDSLVCISQKQKKQTNNFTNFQSVYGCLSVYKHNVSPGFHNYCLSQLSFQLSRCLFTRTHDSI